MTAEQQAKPPTHTPTQTPSSNRRPTGDLLSSLLAAAPATAASGSYNKPLHKVPPKGQCCGGKVNAAPRRGRPVPEVPLWHPCLVAGLQDSPCSGGGSVQFHEGQGRVRKRNLSGSWASGKHNGCGRFRGCLQHQRSHRPCRHRRRLPGDTREPRDIPRKPKKAPKMLDLKKLANPRTDNSRRPLGADGGIRTPTPWWVLGPKPSASARFRHVRESSQGIPQPTAVRFAGWGCAPSGAVRPGWAAWAGVGVRGGRCAC